MEKRSSGPHGLWGSQRVRVSLLLSVVCVAFLTLSWPRQGRSNAEWVTQGIAPWTPPPSYVTIERGGRTGNRFWYSVNGKRTLFIGMGYNAIYRYLSDEQREANYRRDFKLLCQAGVNHITGWDRDKGYDQDVFDEMTLDLAYEFGIGVVVPIFMDPDADYRDETFVETLRTAAQAKVERFRNHPAVRMWGLGNEVLTELPRDVRAKFGRVYLEIADLVHQLDPNHPVIYREAEVLFVPGIRLALESSGTPRPWLLYGMNVYSLELERFLDEWPGLGLDRPLFVTEFGAEPDWAGGRATGYVNMWRSIRAHPRRVLGGAPYVWTTEGPEPVDKKWGLVDGNSQPVDDTFHQLAQEWSLEQVNEGRTCPA